MWRRGEIGPADLEGVTTGTLQRRPRRPPRVLGAAWVLWLLAAPLLAAETVPSTQPGSSTQPASAPATQPAEPVEVAAARADTWVSRPTREERIEAFAPAADIRYRVYTDPKPLRLWIARIELTAPDVRAAVTEPTTLPDEEGSSRETLCADTLQFARQRGVQLAINASAFAPFRPRLGMPMDVVGLGADRGRIYSQPDPRFGAMVLAPSGRIALKGPPLDTQEVWDIVAGFRLLLDDGHIAVTDEEANSSFGGVNPRTAVGVDQTGGTLWIVVVDGRQKGVSAGMTLVELAVLFRSLGVWDALNLDGGGSTAFVLENTDGTHSVINTPSGLSTSGTLRQVATNVGFYLPGPARTPAADAPRSLRDTVIRLASARRGGGYHWKGDGVSRDITYDGRTVLRANPAGTFCCGATLQVFLEAYALTVYGTDLAALQGRWFQDWPPEKFRALQQAWWGTDDAPTNDLLPAEARATIREKQVYHALPWTGFGTPVDDYHLLQRGDFVQFWRRSGSGHSAIFWGCDRDEAGRERFWYWSSQGRPRYAYPLAPGGEPVKTPGYGLNWEFVGDDIDPARIYGVRLIDVGAP
jgi:hypothetical protein